MSCRIVFALIFKVTKFTVKLYRNRQILIHVFRVRTNTLKIVFLENIFSFFTSEASVLVTFGKNKDLSSK